MNIILTRPLNDTENLMQELFNLGHKIMHIPTLKIKNANLEKINIEDYNALVFTSSNAVRNLKVNGEKKNIKCFCVGSVTEKVARLSGFTKTISASGNVNALKNLIINSKELKKNDRLAYICGDQITLELDKELGREGFKVKKIVNYFSEKITSLNDANIDLIKKYPPNVIFVYSLRSAESFNSIVANYSLAPMMTQSVVMCISKKIVEFFDKSGWKNNKIFNPGNEIIELEKIK
jgi:uroporphyrinogen-III synthase